MQVELSKYHGYGNDFLVLTPETLPEREFSRFSRAVCDRNFGVGADGCVFVTTSKGTHEIRIFNCDGSEAGMSGNGSRCAAAYLAHQHGLGPEIHFSTRSGPKRFTLLEHHLPGWRFRSFLGEPGFEPHQIPFRSHQSEIRDFGLKVGGEVLRVHALSMGNPQCAVFCDDVPSDDEFQRWGSALEVHERFSDRTNVSFVTVINPHQLRIRIWERGVGPTHSSGTGSCGAAVAAIRAGVANSPVRVFTETGSQEVTWEGQEVELVGVAEFIANIQYEWPETAP